MILDYGFISIVHECLLLCMQVNELQTSLEQKTISITQCPIDRYPFAAPSESDDSAAKPEVSPIHTQTHQHKASNLAPSTTTSAGLRFSTQTANSTDPNTPIKTTSFAVGFQRSIKGHATLDCLFSIEKENELCLWLENDVIQTKVLLSSPHLGSLKMRGELLLKMLIELQEIITLLTQCQDKVLRTCMYM